MKKVLVTGAGGFIGSNLVEYLIEKGLKVKAFTRYNSTNNWGWLEKSKIVNEVEVVTGDIRDFDSVKKAMVDCDTVFHLAALIGIPYSYVSPAAYIKTNIEGTYNILESAKELQLENILVTSTSETYGSAQYKPIDEKHPMVGQSPYSATKIAADQLAISYHRSFDLPVKIVRPFNTFGPRQSARAIIPTIITQLLTDKSKVKVGNTHTRRDLTYVKDTAKGFYEIYKSDRTIGEIVNIGMNEETSIETLIKIIAAKLNCDPEIVIDGERIRPEKSEVIDLICDNTKIKNFTDWEPDFNLEKGLEETIQFLQNNIQLYKPKIYTI
jgi:NAD dependent epimerase/dehydratase